jgi:hypothetical protein
MGNFSHGFQEKRCWLQYFKGAFLIYKCCDDVCRLTVSSHRILSEFQRPQYKVRLQAKKDEPYVEKCDWLYATLN